MPSAAPAEINANTNSGRGPFLGLQGPKHASASVDGHVKSLAKRHSMPSQQVQVARTKGEHVGSKSHSACTHHHSVVMWGSKGNPRGMPSLLDALLPSLPSPCETPSFTMEIIRPSLQLRKVKQKAAGCWKRSKATDCCGNGACHRLAYLQKTKVLT